MLRTIDSRTTPELLYALACMGHGDEIAIVDSNFPAYATARNGRVVELAGVDAPTAVELVLKLIPLDTFVESPCFRMEVVGNKDRWEPVHSDAQVAIDHYADVRTRLVGMDRFAFYDRAAKAFAVIRSNEQRLYGCFLLKMGALSPHA